MMFGPRLNKASLTEGTTPAPAAAGGPPRASGLDELADPRSIATFSAWGHAAIAPTDQDLGAKLGQPPFTI